MILLVRILIVASGIAAILLGTGPPVAPSRVLTAAVAAGACLAGVATAHLGWRRPLSDALAWSGAAVCLFALGEPDDASIHRVLPVAAGVVTMAVGLHVPGGRAPPIRIRSTLAAWSVVAVVQFFVAWSPYLFDRGDLVVLDPQTSAGIALRFIAVAAFVALAATVLSVWRARQQPSPE